VLEDELYDHDHDDGDNDESHDAVPRPKCKNDQAFSSHASSPACRMTAPTRRSTEVLVVCVRVDLPSLRLVMLGRGTFLLGAFCLIFGP
jgi:hypothetical protein